MFCGYMKFASKFPSSAVELVHFRTGIGEKGMTLILKKSMKVNDRWASSLAIRKKIATNQTKQKDLALYTKVLK